jgi:hypothetical protein
LADIVDASLTMRFHVGGELGNVFLEASDVFGKGFGCFGGRGIHK